MEKVKTIAVNAAFIALISVILIWSNTYSRQRVQFDKGERAAATGDFLAAVAGYESALHMYTPASPLMDRAAQKLWELGDQAFQRQDLPRALIAYRALRSSIYAVAGLHSPGKEWIAKCDARIAELLRIQQMQQSR